MLFLYTKKSHIVASCKGKGEVYMYVNMAQSTHITHTIAIDKWIQASQQYFRYNKKNATFDFPL